jgi:hypothetical protein
VCFLAATCSCMTMTSRCCAHSMFIVCLVVVVGCWCLVASWYLVYLMVERVTCWHIAISDQLWLCLRQR